MCEVDFGEISGDLDRVLGNGAQRGFAFGSVAGESNSGSNDVSFDFFLDQAEL